MTVQAAVADPVLIEGMLRKGPYPHDIISRVCEGDLAAGRLLVWGTDPATQVAEMAALPAADVDAIATAAVVIAAAAAQTIAAGDFDGAIGADRISPARVPSISFDASTDWDIAAGITVTWYGRDAGGANCSCSVNKATGSGALALYGDVPMSAIDHVDISAGSAATGGAATLGVANDRVELSPNEYPGVALYRGIKEPNTAVRNYADEEAVDLLVKGDFVAIPEHAVSAGDDVYVRVLAAGTDLRGQFTGMDGAMTPASYARLIGAKWRSPAAADGLAIIRLTGV